MSAVSINDKREVCIDLSWLLEQLTAEQKRELVDSLACENDVIEDVTAQLLDGWTSLGSHGANTSGDSEPNTPLGKARRAVAMRSGEVAQKEILDLKVYLVWQKRLQEHYSSAYYSLYHAWPEGFGKMPVVPQVTYDISPGEYEVIRKTPITEAKL